MDAEEAFGLMLAPYRDAARRRVERGTAGPAPQIQVIADGEFVTYEPVEDVDGIPAGVERHAEPLGEWSDSDRDC